MLYTHYISYIIHPSPNSLSFASMDYYTLFGLSKRPFPSPAQ